VYGDLKPENIVITASCHAKIADFGGCRPVTQEARQRTLQSVLSRLRDGDWRASDEVEEEESAEGGQSKTVDAAAVVEDNRIEGTALYLPPEVVRGAAPTILGDAWALGCLVCQVLTGKPPMWVETELEADIESRIVSFDLDGCSDVVDTLSESARGLVGRLLQADVSQRVSVEATAGDAFFEDLDVFTLYTKPRGPEIATPSRRKAAAAADGGGDARWNKRQFSKIWSVMPSPQDYELSSSSTGARFSKPQRGDSSSSAPNFEETSLERNAPFVEELVDVPAPPPETRPASRVESI